MTKNLIKETNNYLANIGVMYIKLHNLHWNVKGTQFKAVHEYLQSIYDFFATTLDEVAEFIKMEDEFPLAKLTDYLEVATITELDNVDYSVKDTLEILLTDILKMKEEASSLRNYSDKVDKFILTNMLEEHITEYTKIIWFVSSMLK